MDLSEELKNHLLAQGTALVGYGDLSSVPGCAFPRGVAIAVPVPANIVSEIMDGPTPAYFDTYHHLNAELDRIAMSAEALLNSRGYSAFAQTTSRIRENENCCTPLPHKTVAVRACIGWIGKSCLLVTKEFGSAVRITSILTDAPLRCGVPALASNCGSCMQCVKACPAQALSGRNWGLHTGREAIVDIHACQKKQVELSREKAGMDSEFLCGKCFAICPYSLNYIKASTKNGTVSN